MSQNITEEYHEFDLDSNLENVFDSQNSQDKDDSQCPRLDFLKEKT